MRSTRGLTALSALVAVFAVVLYGGTAVAASAPINIGSGHYPTVAVDGVGTAYIVWDHQISSSQDAVDLCVLPRGSGACSHTLELRPGQNIFSPPYVFVPSPGVVWVLVASCCSPDQALLYASTDAGQTFGPATRVGALSPSGDATLGPGSAISVVTDSVTGATYFQRDASDGSSGGMGTSIGSDEYGGTIGLFAGQPVVAYWDFGPGAPNHVDFTAYRGSGDYNSSASWTSPVAIGPGSDTRIASGSGGLFLMYKDGQRYFVRRYTGSGFGPPTDIAGPEDGHFNAFYEDPAGRLHAIWSVSSGALRYTVSADGVHWGQVVTVANDSTGVFHPHAALAGDGRGWAAWDNNDQTGRVWATPLDYLAAVGGGVAGPTPGQQSITVGTDVITLKAPAACVRPVSITAYLSVRSQKRKGHVVVKVKQVDFSVDRKLKKRVKHAPFRAVLKITDLKPKSRHVVSAHVLLKSRHGPQRSRTINVGFSVC